MQDDYSEEWQDQNHVIKITATEGLGILKNIQLSNNGAEIEVMSTPWELIQFAMQGLPLDWSKYMIMNNLYHDSMSNLSPNTSLTQCKIDPKTFDLDDLRTSDIAIISELEDGYSGFRSYEVQS